MPRLDTRTHGTEAVAGVLVRIIRTLLHDERFETSADLTDAVKFRCAKLRIRWTPSAISDAFSIIEAGGTSLVPVPRRALSSDTLVQVPPMLNHATAARILQQLQAGPKTIDTEKDRTPWRDVEQDALDEDAARRRAADMGITL